MQTWLIEPRDPMVFRDGRPFGADPGARATSLPLPLPSTIAGAWRSRAGRDGAGVFDAARIPALQEAGFAGPLLAVLDAAGDWQTFGVPQPLDALMMTAEGAPRALQVHRLVPRLLPGETDLPVLAEGPLLPLSFSGPAPLGKPASQRPAYWRYACFERWLLEPRGGAFAPADGLAGPGAESRMHVGVGATRTALDSQLFMTEGRRFVEPAPTEGVPEPLGLLFAAPDEEGVEGLGTLGGERRLAHYRKSARSMPVLPEGLVERLIADGGCRLILLTPGLFAEGWRPSAILQHPGVRLTLRAAASDRPVVFSGWDYAQNAPKPTRRAARAGSVYFVELEGEASAIREWASRVWFRCISDDAQDSRDGFGLAALGTWNPKE